MLLRETNAAVEIRKHSDSSMDFTPIDVILVCPFILLFLLCLNVCRTIKMKWNTFEFEYLCMRT